MKNLYLKIFAFVYLALIPISIALIPENRIEAYILFIIIPLYSFLFVFNMILSFSKKTKPLNWIFGILYSLLVMYLILTIIQLNEYEDFKEITHCLIASFVISFIIFILMKTANREPSPFAILFNTLAIIDRKSVV